CPYALRGGRHVDVPDPEVGDGVDHGVLDGRGGADRPGLADALRPQRVQVGRRLAVGELEAGQVGRGNSRVVGERGGQRVAVRVVEDLLKQGLSRALGDPAVPLAFGQDRVQYRARVVDGDVPEHLHLAGFDVDLDHRDVGAERERGPVGGEGDVRDQAAAAGVTGDLGPGQGGVRVTADLPRTGGGIEYHVGFGGFEHFRGL